MKVLVIVPDVGRYGGTSSFLERLLQIHARHGYVTTLLVPTGQCYPGLVSWATRYGAELIQSPNRTVPGTAPFLTPLFDFLFSWRAVLTRRPDLIVVSTGEPGRLSISLYYPIPVLYILHTIPDQRFRFLPRLYLWLGSMLGNCVMAVSNAAAESVSNDMGISRSRVEVVYNSCRVAAYRNEADKPIILTAGHLVPYKNPELWLEVAYKVLQKCPGAVFVWLGDGELLETIRKKLKGTPWEKQILLPGYELDPSQWYAVAHIYFQPSLRENHSIAVLEAMSYGLPCVVANTGGLPESVVDGETGYVCLPDDPAGYAFNILKLIENQELSKQMGRKGKDRCAHIFSEDQQEQKILTLYKRLAKTEF